MDVGTQRLANAVGKNTRQVVRRSSFVPLHVEPGRGRVFIAETSSLFRFQKEVVLRAAVSVSALGTVS